ncbi:hypothetical protein GW750_07890 [bacterium]|nr:hypothetical protein [bacterium]
MTTITIDQNIEMTKTHFYDMEELVAYLVESYVDINFTELSKEEVTFDLQKLVNESKKKSTDSFYNL